MPLPRPRTDLYNGCVATALAVVLNSETEAFYYPLDGGHYPGMTTNRLLAVLVSRGIQYDLVQYHRARRLRTVLPITGRGIVTVSRGRRHHAIAFDGHMVYDVNTDGRWQWVHDHVWATGGVRELITLTEAQCA